MKVVDRYGHGAHHLFVVHGVASSLEVLFGLLEGVEDVLCVPHHTGLVEQDAQAEFPVFSDAACGVPCADVFEVRRAYEHA